MTTEQNELIAMVLEEVAEIYDTTLLGESVVNALRKRANSLRASPPPFPAPAKEAEGVELDPAEYVHHTSRCRSSGPDEQCTCGAVALLDQISALRDLEGAARRFSETGHAPLYLVESLSALSRLKGDRS